MGSGGQIGFKLDVVLGLFTKADKLGSGKYKNDKRVNKNELNALKSSLERQGKTDTAEFRALRFLERHLSTEQLAGKGLNAQNMTAIAAASGDKNLITASDFQAYKDQQTTGTAGLSTASGNADMESIFADPNTAVDKLKALSLEGKSETDKDALAIDFVLNINNATAKKLGIDVGTGTFDDDLDDKNISDADLKKIAQAAERAGQKDLAGRINKMVGQVQGLRWYDQRTPRNSDALPGTGDYYVHRDNLKSMLRDAKLGKSLDDMISETNAFNILTIATGGHDTHPIDPYHS